MIFNSICGLENIIQNGKQDLEISWYLWVIIVTGTMSLLKNYIENE